MTQRFKTVSRPLLGLLIGVSVLPYAGCEGFEPSMFPVGDTVVLHSLARPEFIGRRSGFDFIAPQAVLVERPKSQQEELANFDVAFSELEGEFVFLPAGMFESVEAAAGIAVDSSGVTFEELVEAPKEGFVTDSAVVLREGPIYIVRTRQQRAACSQFAKVEVLDLDPAGILEFRFLRNNLCNDRTLTDIDGD